MGGKHHRKDGSTRDTTDEFAASCRKGPAARRKPSSAPLAMPAFIVNIEPLPDGSARFQRTKEGCTPAVTDLLHRATVDVSPYFALIAEPESKSTAIDFVEKYVAEMQPRNPAERMLAVQMLWQHARIARLTMLAAVASRGDQLKQLDAAIDSAMGVYRKQSLTWQELRTPRPVQIIRGHQVNMADKQLIAQTTGAARQLAAETNSVENENASNKQGSDGPPTPPALPAERAWPGVFEGDCAEREAVAVEHRPADARR